MDSGISRVAVIGAGAMGSGIAHAFAAAGYETQLFDSRADAAQAAKRAIHKTLQADVAKGRRLEDTVPGVLGRLHPIGSLDEARRAELVVEAITENLQAKQELFAHLESLVSDDCILASNTSSLSITTLASSCSRPQRIAGMHFFNPVARMPLVEVIEGLKTVPAVGDVLAGIVANLGKEVARVKDTPGFLVNQAGRAYTLEAMNIVAEGVASCVDVDRVMRDAGGFRMGPFELLDMIGLDVNHPATEAIYSQFFHEPHYRPSRLMDMRLRAGLLGRKTGEGFYRYGEAGAVISPEPPAPASRPRSVWVNAQPADEAHRLRQLLVSLGSAPETGNAPSPNALCFVTPLGEDASRAAARLALDPRRTVAVDTMLPLDRRRTLMTTCVTEPSQRDAAHGLLASDGVPVTVIRDSAGFIAQRIIAMIVNIGATLAQARTASPADIDRAVALGLAYPHGPLAFADTLGVDRIAAILEGLYASSRELRYRPSLWLARRAALGRGMHDGE